MLHYIRLEVRILRHKAHSGYDSSGKTLAYQAWGLEFNPHYGKKNKNKTEKYENGIKEFGE
jgi:hypothetical protein